MSTISLVEVRFLVDQYLRPGDLPDRERAAALVFVSMVVSETAFHCSGEQRGAALDHLSAFFADETAAPEDARAKLYGAPDPAHGDWLIRRTHLSEARDLYRALLAPPASLPARTLDAWLAHAWRNGLQQARVCAMEEEGSIMTLTGIVEARAAHLAMFGEREGLFPCPVPGPAPGPVPG